ncbi:MAG TPA: apolipoprotein N-acyltransferase [Geobacteraceae bacterium]
MDYRRFGLPDFNAVPRRDYGLAILTGGLLALAFPKPELSILAWVAFVPLLLACGHRSPRQAFQLGFVSGLTAYGGLLYWLNIVMVTYGKLHWSVSVCLYVLLAAYLALYFGVIAFLVRRGEERGISPLFSFPLLWVGLEYFRSFFLSGFPWASLGYSQYRHLLLIQIVDLVGVYGVSLLIALVNVVLYRCIKGVATRERDAVPLKAATLCIVLLALTLAYGYWRLRQPENGPQMKVALIQGNISQDIKWDPAFQEATVAIYERLSRRAAAAGPDLVIWPESAAPFFFQKDALYAERIKALVRQLKSYLVFGSPAFEIDGDRLRYLNSAFLLAPTGEVLGRSDKIHLVPFGEYVPLARLLPFVTKLVEGIGDFSPGKEAKPLNTGKGEIGVLVCFEGIFPELSRAYVRAGSRLLVNISNDAWYKRSSAPGQHLAMTVFRAVENRVPLVRATNTGISAIIDSRGGLHDTTPLFEEAIVAGTVRLGEGRTVYNRCGDLFASLCLTAAAGIAWLALRKKGHHAQG